MALRDRDAVKPNPLHARDRAVVSCDLGGRRVTGRLAFWPHRSRKPNGKVSPGRKARVILPSGKWVSVDPDTIELVEGPTE